MTDILIFVFGVLFGYFMRRDVKPPVLVDVLQCQVEELENQVNYYKDLCNWHVEEKEKLKQEHYIK